MDVANQMHSPFLSETTPYVGRNGKILFTEYKGEMTADSLDAMIKTRDAQLAEREQMKKESAFAEKSWARHDEHAEPGVDWVPRSNKSLVSNSSWIGDILSMLISIYGSKEIFVNEYRF